MFLLNNTNKSLKLKQGSTTGKTETVKESNVTGLKQINKVVSKILEKKNKHL